MQILLHIICATVLISAGTHKGSFRQLPLQSICQTQQKVRQHRTPRPSEPVRASHRSRSLHSLHQPHPHWILEKGRSPARQAWTRSGRRKSPPRSSTRAIPSGFWDTASTSRNAALARKQPMSVFFGSRRTALNSIRDTVMPIQYAEIAAAARSPADRRTENRLSAK